MNVAGAAADGSGPADRTGRTRRVREEVRDGIAVVAFSAAASSVLAAVLLLLVTWVG